MPLFRKESEKWQIPAIPGSGTPRYTRQVEPDGIPAAHALEFVLPYFRVRAFVASGMAGRHFLRYRGRPSDLDGSHYGQEEVAGFTYT